MNTFQSSEQTMQDKTSYMMLFCALRLVSKFKATLEPLVTQFVDKARCLAGKLANRIKSLRASEDRVSEVVGNPADKAEYLTRVLAEKDREHEGLLEELHSTRLQLRKESEVAKTYILQMEIERNETRFEIDRTRSRQVEQELCVQDLKAERQNLNQELAAKEQELCTLRQDADYLLSQTCSLEATLKQSEERFNELRADLASQKALVENLQVKRSKGRRTKKAPQNEANLSANTSHVVKETEPPSPNKADDLYKQAITPLTVLRASVDILAMDSQVDASLRETTGVIKMQSQVLLDLIKSHAFPAETQSNGSY